ncbi:protoheme IX farnesyltransferase [Acrocarpospora phusangensis]|uniref:Protoheme IX farnesyltransferase n=1 Tax=Acrocarpospora phusangensis TaxID=1070424 RepID=A0A919QAX7_9ACTN|nr:heme o synthase [Acrocarpospora phusangensis]GIH24681.1 protoheme IX farnesyltransferase [Acrocarpospora phusangensis]
MTVLTNNPTTVPAGAATTARRTAGEVVRAYVALTKPRIIELLLITTLPVMFLAARGLPDLWPATWTMVFGTLSAGSANALNCYIDRDIDEVMRRTRRRPLARHQVSPRGALVFGVILGALSTFGLALTVNWIAAWLSLAAILFYVLVYSMILKRRTSQNIVWGGIAGCMPVLIGWAGITGELAWAPLVLFGVVFFWTPPHTWTLAMRYREDYAAAAVPMLPVVASDRVVVRQVIAYTWATVLCSLLLWPVAATTPLYPAVAAALGAACLFEVYALRRRLNAGKTGVDLRPMRFFHWSNIYLALLFLAVAVDSLLV